MAETYAEQYGVVVRSFFNPILDDLGGNLMLWDGCSDDEIVEYALAYTPHTERQMCELLQSLKSPLKQIYAFTYSQGKRRIQPLLQDDDLAQVFRRLLTEPVYPSLLAERASNTAS